MSGPGEGHAASCGVLRASAHDGPHCCDGGQETAVAHVQESLRSALVHTLLRLRCLPGMATTAAYTKMTVLLLIGGPPPWIGCD